MVRSVLARRSLYLSLSYLLVATISQEAEAQLTGTYHSAPGTMATYEYQGDGFESVLLPVDVTMNFSGDPTPTLTATIYAPIIGDTPDFNYPIVGEFPMVVTGITTDGQTFRGDLLGTQYLFEWEIESTAGGELVWNGEVGWAGGRFELTTITDARLIPGVAGDYNQNGTVDAADYVIWRSALGETGRGLAADGDGSETVDAGDYAVWQSHFGQNSATVASLTGAIPEPATVWLVMIALAKMLRPSLARSR